MIELTQARELLKRAVETQGRDFVYAPLGASDGLMCSYVIAPKRDDDDDRPCTKTGCLIGVALDLAGETRHRNHSTLSIITVSRQNPGMLSADAESYFNIAQVAQDKNHASWGAAYDLAEAWAMSVVTA